MESCRCRILHHIDIIDYAAAGVKKDARVKGEFAVITTMTSDSNGGNVFDGTISLCLKVTIMGKWMC